MMAAMTKYLHNGAADYRCNVALAKGTFGNIRAAFAISKNNPLFEPFQRGYLLFTKQLIRIYKVSFNCCQQFLAGLLN